MSLKKIIIYQNNVLFNILDEIKEKFNFELINADEKNFYEYQKNTKKDFIVISRSEEKKINNQLIIGNIPIKLDKLLEKINLKFLKEKFNYQSDIDIGSYKLNLNSREIGKNDKIINLTEREINLILFLKEASKGVKIDELQKKVWSYSSHLETHTVETHIYRLRKKIKENFNDDNFIISSNEGYLIN
tara:strand:+ start:324 stop:887 length:564 start_codon:yes stop_codon:yes gene_type:complete